MLLYRNDKGETVELQRTEIDWRLIFADGKTYKFTTADGVYSFLQANNWKEINNEQTDTNDTYKQAASAPEQSA